MKNTDPVQAEHFGKWLRGRLKRWGWSQSHFADRIGKDKGVVGNWVRGQRIPSPESCDLIADVLSIDRDIVLAQAGHRSLDPGFDPQSPEAIILPLVRRVNWTPFELDRLVNDLQFLLDYQSRQPGPDPRTLGGDVEMPADEIEQRGVGNLNAREGNGE